MKIRTDFVTNSSSSSFVINISTLRDTNRKKELENMIKRRYKFIQSDDLLNLCVNSDVDNIYYVVDYDDGDIYHCWVKRDESMYYDGIDNELNKFEDNDISPKFNYHY